MQSLRSQPLQRMDRQVTIPVGLGRTHLLSVTITGATTREHLLWFFGPALEGRHRNLVLGSVGASVDLLRKGVGKTVALPRVCSEAT